LYKILVVNRLRKHATAEVFQGDQISIASEAEPSGISSQVKDLIPTN